YRMSDYQVDAAAVVGVASSLHGYVDGLEGTAASGQQSPDAGAATATMTRQLAILRLACGALVGGLRDRADSATASGQLYDATDDAARGRFQVGED
ncbi:MAG: hypothetical protein ACRDI1_05185, partial [Actinomycetota bacterium]